MKNHLARSPALLLALAAGCMGEFHDPGASLTAPDAGLSSDVISAPPQTGANTRTTAIALAEFEAYADPTTGQLVFESVTQLDPYPQLMALYEDRGLRTIGQAIDTEAPPAPWCIGRVVNDGAIGTNPPNSFELWTNPATIASALPGELGEFVVPAACNAGNTSLYWLDGVFCASVRAKNFYAVPWSDVYVQLNRFPNELVASHGGQTYPFGTGAQVNNAETGELLPALSRFPMGPTDPAPIDVYGLWDYGDIAASGGESTVVWSFRNQNTANGGFSFRGRILGQVAENCATTEVDEDCDGNPQNGCRVYPSGDACTLDADCISNVCDAGFCTDGCGPGLFGEACESECPGGAGNPCNGNGFCDEGQLGSGSCTCADGYFGTDCTETCEPGEEYEIGTGCVATACAPGTLDFYGDASACLTVTQVSAGGYHTCAIMSDGTLWCWGRNNYGQLGNGNTLDRTSAVQVGTWTDWTSVDTGSFHTCALRTGGLMYCWGWSSEGQAGTMAAINSTPVLISPGWSSVSAGYNHTCGVGSDARIYCFGSGAAGQRGIGGSTVAGPTVTQVQAAVPQWATVSAGYGYTCGVTPAAGFEGAYCWGQSFDFQLGIGDTVTRVFPVGVAPLIDAVSTGWRHTCAIRDDGRLTCWGRNEAGQLGTGNTSVSSAPALVGSATNWLSVGLGLEHTCGLRSDGIYCWGSDTYGAIGDGATTGGHLAPYLVASEAGWTQLSAGFEHNCAVRNGAVYCWGRNEYGQLGYDGVGDAPTPVSFEPEETTLPPAVTSLTATTNRSDGVLVSWAPVSGATGYELRIGSGVWVPLAVGTTSYLDTTANLPALPLCAPVASDGTSWTGVSLSCSGTVTSVSGTTQGYYVRAVNTDGVGPDSYVSGRRVSGTITVQWQRSSGDSDSGYGNVSGLVGRTANDTGTAAGAGRYYRAVLSGGAGVPTVTTAANRGFRRASCAEGRIDVLNNGTQCDTITRLSAGWEHTCAITSSGRLFCWGDNPHGQLGNGTTLSQRTPVQVGTATNWSQVSAGSEYSCGRRGGEIYCWGRNHYGQLGDGTTTSRTSPVRIGTATDWSQIDVGYWHTCGRRGGALYCWGWNDYGQVGDNSTTDRRTPVRVGTATDWSEVSTGGTFTCGRRGGELYCWGENGSYQLGDGTFTNRRTPLRIGTATNWSQIYTGYDHTCGRRGGELYCWGYNAYSQVGDGTSWNLGVPVRVGTATDWSDVSLGRFHTCGRRGGDLYCWGSNDYGEIGDGSLNYRSTPRRVGTASNWSGLSVNGMFGCGHRSGALYCWGQNSYGQLGDNTVTNRRSPVPIYRPVP